MSRAKGNLVGVDIGGTKIRAVMCTPDFKIVADAEAPTPAREGGAMMAEVVHSLVEKLQGEGHGNPVAIGLGAAGVIDSANGVVRVASDSFSGWAGYPVTDRLQQLTGVPVTLGNDVNSFLQGEVTAGAVRGEGDVLAMMLGTGVGGALRLGGALFEGGHGGAGEIGHVPGFGNDLCSCGGRGHLETLASGRSIARRYQERTGREMVAAEVADLARGGDVWAEEIFATAGRGVARAISMVAGLLDIDAVVIGGGVSGAWDLLEPAVLGELRDAPPVNGRMPHIRRSSLGADAAALGAAVLAVDAAGR